MIVTNTLSMDLLRPGLYQVINAVQGEAYTRCLEMSLYAGGVAWTIPEDVTASVRYRKSDGTKGYYDTLPDGQAAFSTAGNVLRVTLAPQMLTVPGEVLFQIELLQGSSLLVTFCLRLLVEADPAAGTLVSEDYINWLQWMVSELDTKLEEAAASGKFTGPMGPTGPTPVLLSSETTYQVSDSGTEVPSGEWQKTVPAVAQGKYLWGKVCVTFETGTVTYHTVTRMGKDGKGQVSSVAGILPDDSGDIPLAEIELLTKAPVKCVWTNTSTEEFPAQSVEVDIADNDLYFILFKTAAGAVVLGPTVFCLGSFHGEATMVATPKSVFERQFYVESGQLSFTDCTHYLENEDNTISDSIRNINLVPYAVYKFLR